MGAIYNAFPSHKKTYDVKLNLILNVVLFTFFFFTEYCICLNNSTNDAFTD